jgi:adenosylhomocysteine nucleosidase
VARPEIVGLIVALPEEARGLARVIGSARREHIPGPGAGCHVLRGVIGRQRVLVAWAGAGAAAADRAAAAALSRGASVLLAVGFAGALVTGLRVGAIVLASDIREPGGDRWVVDEALLASLFGAGHGLPGGSPTAERGSEGVPATAREVCRGPIVTVSYLVADAAQKHALGEETGGVAVDMESAAIARHAARAGVPMGALRVITDGAKECLPPELETCFDSAGQFHRARLLRVLARRPSTTRDLVRLGRQAARAGRELSSFLEGCLS